MSDIAREMKSVGDMYENAVDMIRTGNTQHMETFMLAKDRITDLDIALQQSAHEACKGGTVRFGAYSAVYKDPERHRPYKQLLPQYSRVSEE